MEKKWQEYEKLKREIEEDEDYDEAIARITRQLEI